MGVPENIDALLVKYDINQEALANIAGVAPSAVTRWRQGSAIRKTNLRNICDYFGLEEDDIISDRAGLAAKEHSHFADIPGAHPVRGVPMVKVPLVGRVHAGPAGDPDVYEDTDDAVEIPQTYLDIDPECVAVDFEGDCMLTDFGDATTLVVSPNSPFGNGSIVVAAVDGADYVVRRMEQNARELRLKASNTVYDDIVIPRNEEHDVEFKGKVLGCFRRFE